MKSNKALGPPGITTELIKALDAAGVDRLYTIRRRTRVADPSPEGFTT